MMNKIQPSLSGYQVNLIPVQESHLERLRQWRNSQHVKQYMLTQDEISKEQQAAWYAHIRRSTNQLHFMIEYRQQLIGSCNIKTRGNHADINQAEHFELGMYIGEPAFLGNIIAFAPTLVLNDYCFQQLNAESLYAIVKPENQAALRYNKKLGYQVISQDALVELTLNQADYQQHSKLIKRLLDRPATKNKKD